jgi:hypothetical protein
MIPEDDEVTATTTVRVDAASSSRSHGSLRYYASGSDEVATETPVTLTRLEAVR